MGKTNNFGKKISPKYKPFYPTTVGPVLHDVTFQKLPSYSIRPKPDPINKKCSPGPAAYPGDHSMIGKKKHKQVPRTIYPADKAHKYSIGVKGKDFTVARTPGPAAYPYDEFEDRNPLKPLPSIYPKDKGNIFSMRKKKDEKYSTVSPGPAIYPRDAEREDVINSIHPRDLANKFSMVPRRDVKLKVQSPGPAVYPINKIGTIYPAETQLPPTMKGIYNIKDRQKTPAPNSYFMKKITTGRNAPKYSLGVRHTPKQHYLVVPEDEY